MQGWFAFSTSSRPNSTEYVLMCVWGGGWEEGGGAETIARARVSFATFKDSREGKGGGGRDGGRDRHTDRLTETETMHSACSLINTHDDSSFLFSSSSCSLSRLT